MGLLSLPGGLDKWKGIIMEEGEMVAENLSHPNRLNDLENS